MADERADEEIVELTEDMASVPPPPPEEGGNEETAEDSSSDISDNDDDGNDDDGNDDDGNERPSQPPIGGKFTLMDQESDTDEDAARVSRADIEEIEETSPEEVGLNEESDDDEAVEVVVDEELEDDEQDDDETVEIDEEDTEEIAELDADELEVEEEEEHEAEELQEDEIVEIPALPTSPKAPPKIAVKPKTKPTGKRRRRRAKEWWNSIFDESFLSLVPNYTARDIRREADFISKSLSLSNGSLLLDLACGTGRQAVAMAQRGYRIVGVDLSLPMLARAGERAQKADQNINFIHGDMRDLGFEQTFDGIYCVGTSFGFFDDATNLKVLEGIRRALKPGAPFLLEVANRDFALDKAPNLTWFEGKNTVCLEEVEFNYISSRLEINRQIIMGDDTGRQMKHEYSLRLYSLHELGLMLHKAGLTVHNVCGHANTPDAFFGVDSAQIIILAQRR